MRSDDIAERYDSAMRRHLGSVALGLAVGILGWVITTTLGLLAMPWSILAGAVIGIIVTAGAILILNRNREPGTHRVVSGLRSGGRVRVSDVEVTTKTGSDRTVDVVSDIRSAGDMDISRVQDKSE